MKLKSVLLKTATAAMSALLALQNPVSALTASAATRYISDLYLSYAKSGDAADVAAAKQWLTDNGYTVVGQDLTEGGDAMLSKKRPVFLGYKTTDDPKEAITDLRALSMSGDYNYYEGYEQLLASQAESTAIFLEDVKAALKEYRENLSKDTAKGTIAYESLNKLRDPDSGMLLGDLLKNTIKEEDEAAYKADPSAHADMTMMLMQGNSNAVKAMMQDLAYAADSSGKSWLDRLKTIRFSDMQKAYEEEYPAVAASRIQSMMTADYDADAKILAGQIADLNTMLKAYDSSGIHFDDAGFTEESADAYFEAHPDENQIAWARAGQLEALLKTCTYGDGTMYSFMTDKERDFLNNQGDRMELFPFLEAFSPAQRRLLSYTTMEQLFITGLLDEQGWEDTYDRYTELIENTPQMSIYEGVNRAVVNSGSIALTGDAFDRQQSTGVQALDPGLFGTGMSCAAPIMLAGSLALGAAGGTLIVKSGMFAKPVYETIVVETSRVAELDAALLKQWADKLSPFFKEEAYRSFIPEIANDYAFLLDGPYVGVSNRIVSSSSEAFLQNVSSEHMGPYINAMKQSGLLTENEASLLESQLIKRIEAEASDLEVRTTEITVLKAQMTRKWMVYLGVSICLVAALIMVGSGIIAAIEMSDYYSGGHYIPIPEFVVDTAKNTNGHIFYTYYDGVKCNRAEQPVMYNDMAYGEMGRIGDMNGDVGKEWLALYWTKDSSAGNPIKEGFTVQTGENGKKIPLGKKALSIFGQENPVNLTDEKYSYSDSLKGLYLYFTQSNTGAAGSVATAGALAATGALSAAAGVGLAFLLGNLKRKKKDAPEAQPAAKA